MQNPFLDEPSLIVLSMPLKLHPICPLLLIQDPLEYLPRIQDLSSISSPKYINHLN